MNLRLSHDVLTKIFNHLNLADLLSVSLTCRAFNEISSRLVYRELHLTWHDINEIVKQPSAADDTRLSAARKVCIRADGRGEWATSPHLPALVSASNDNLRELEIACALRSSGWFKYIGTPLLTIRKLKLTTGCAVQNYAFDFAHVAVSVPNIEEIELGDANGGFMIDPFSEGGFHNLARIRVENCEWQYPARLSDAAMNSNLESLEILFSKSMHPFAFSERLRSEFSNLPSSLMFLQVIIDVGKPLNWNPLQRSKPLSFLRKAELRGFEFRYRQDKKQRSTSKFPRLESIDEK